MILPELAAGGNAGLVGGAHAGFAAGADGRAASGVLALGGDVADALVEPVLGVSPGRWR